jgi:hypothetical protein
MGKQGWRILCRRNNAYLHQRIVTNMGDDRGSTKDRFYGWIIVTILVIIFVSIPLYVYSENGSMGLLDWALEGLIMMFIWFGVVAFFKKQ